MIIRIATTNDSEKLQKLYFNTITTINIKDYNSEQINAWASTANRTDSLKNKISTQFFYAATDNNGTILGFASLTENGYLDMLYVHKNHQRKGVATVLWKTILTKANELGIKHIETEASITAKPFFEKHGFQLIKPQIVFINDIGLTNYKMVFDNGKEI